MITVNYFASVREQVGCSREQLELPSAVKSVSDLMDFLATRDTGKRKGLATNSVVMVAVNQTVVGRDHLLKGDEEVAFFPPMTGG